MAGQDWLRRLGSGYPDAMSRCSSITRPLCARNQGAGALNRDMQQRNIWFTPSQWETALFCNAVSHWLGASLESALIWTCRRDIPIGRWIVPIHWLHATVQNKYSECHEYTIVYAFWKFMTKMYFKQMKYASMTGKKICTRLRSISDATLEYPF